MSADLNLKEEIRPLSRVREWGRNPREGHYEGMEELEESLAMVGLQDAIHVWVRPDGDYLLKGHRRFRAMGNLGWVECRMVPHFFEDEAEAYLYLLQDHGHTVALNSAEKLVAMQNGVALGLSADELAPAMGVTVETAQLWFDLGEQLPQVGREALARGTLSMNVAEQILRVDKEDRAKVVQLVLRDSLTNEPMGASQARQFIELQYVLPAKWRRDWVAMSPKLRKRYAAAEGFVVVEWEERLNYVMGDSGQPEADYEYGDGLMSRGGELWMTRAQALGVPVYVVPAPRHEDKMVLVVHRKMIRDAESAVERAAAAESGPVEERVSSTDGGDVVPESGSVAPARDVMAEAEAEAEALAVWLRVMLRRIYEHLCCNPTVVMTNEPWKPLFEYLANLVTDVDAGAAEAWLGVRSAEEMLEWMRKDTKQRAPLRLVLMLLLCAESDASSMPRRVISEVAAGLGVEVEGGEGR